MKFPPKYYLLLATPLLLASCNILKPSLPKAQIPQFFEGFWTDKKKPSNAYCYPQTDHPNYAIWSIKPKKNRINLIGFEFYQLLGFYSLSPTSFSAKAEVSQSDTESVTYQKITVKMLNKNTIRINNRTYYRCPKQPY